MKTTEVAALIQDALGHPVKDLMHTLARSCRSGHIRAEKVARSPLSPYKMYEIPEEEAHRLVKEYVDFYKGKSV